MASAQITRLGTVWTVQFDDDDAHLFREFNWSVTGKATHPYVVRTEVIGGRRRRVLFHRVVTNCPPGQNVDHINGNTLDNRKANLRACSTSENLRNMHARRGASRFKGVAAKGAKWQAVINPDGRSCHLGLFDTEDEAARAYDVAASSFYGAFANLNFPGEPLPHLPRVLRLVERFMNRRRAESVPPGDDVPVVVARRTTDNYAFACPCGNRRRVRVLRDHEWCPACSRWLRLAEAA